MYDFDDDRSLGKRLRQRMIAVLMWLPKLLLRMLDGLERLMRRAPVLKDAGPVPEFRPDGPLKRISKFTSGVLLAIILWLPRLVMRMIEGMDRWFRRLRESEGVLQSQVTHVDASSGRFFRNFVQIINRGWGSLSERINEFRLTIRSSESFQRLKKATYWLWYPVLSLVRFVSAFFNSRSRLALIGSIVLLFVIGAGLFTAWRMHTRRGLLAVNYRLAVQDALSTGDFKTAALYQSKLQSMGVPVGDTEMRQIRQLAESGDLNEAIRMAEQLAPLSKVGLVEAHFWLAQQYLEDKAAIKGPEAIKIAQQHVDLVNEAWQDSTLGQEAKPSAVLEFMQAAISNKSGDITKALIHLRRIDNIWPAIAMQMELYFKLNQQPLAFEAANKLVAIAKRSPQVVESVSPELFSLWSTVLANSQANEDLLFVLQYWIQREPNNPMARSAFANLQMQEVERLLKLGTQQELTKAADLLVENARRLSPEQHKFLIVWFVTEWSSAENGANCRELEQLIKSRENLPSVLLTLLGCIARISGDKDEAIRLIQSAVEQDPNHALGWNLLAQLTIDVPEQLKLAEEAAEKAVALSPEDLDFVETRGSVALKLSNWESAIADLKRVVVRNPNSKTAHKGLALAYEKTGRADLASIHGSLSQE